MRKCVSLVYGTQHAMCVAQHAIQKIQTSSCHKNWRLPSCTLLSAYRLKGGKLKKPTKTSINQTPSWHAPWPGLRRRRAARHALACRAALCDAAGSRALPQALLSETLRQGRPVLRALPPRAGAVSSVPATPCGEGLRRLPQAGPRARLARISEAAPAPGPSASAA